MSEQYFYTDKNECPDRHIPELDARIIGRFARVLAEYESRDPETLRLGETMVVDIEVLEDMINQLSLISSFSEKAAPFHQEAREAEEQLHAYRNNNYKLNSLLLKSKGYLVDQAPIGDEEYAAYRADKADSLMRLIDEVGTNSLPTNLVSEDYFIDLGFGDESFETMQNAFAPIVRYIESNNQQHITIPTHEFLICVQQLEAVLRLVKAVNYADACAKEMKDYLEECRLLCKRKLEVIRRSLSFLINSNDDELKAKADETQRELQAWLDKQVS